MPRVVVVLPTTTYRAEDFFDAASSLGIDLIVASDENPVIDMGDRCIVIDCENPAEAAAAVESLGEATPLDGIVAADDAGVMVAAIAGTRLGLRANPPEAAMATRDKSMMRRLLSQAEVPQPLFAAVSEDADAHKAAETVGYPLVAKPLNRSASQGVLRIDHPDDLASGLQQVRASIGEPRATLLVEEYMPGHEIAVEGLLDCGALNVLAIFDKPDTKPGPTFPETIFVTPSQMSDTDQTEAVRVSEMACRALGLTSGPVHIELKVNDRKTRIIELAARSIGGLCSRSLNFGLAGTSLESLILRNAVGMDKPELRRERSSGGVLMLPIPKGGRFKGVQGESEARVIPGVTGMDITVPVGARIAALPAGDRYVGFVYARGETAAQVETSLRTAQETLRVQVG